MAPPQPSARGRLHTFVFAVHGVWVEWWRTPSSRHGPISNESVGPSGDTLHLPSPGLDDGRGHVAHHPGGVSGTGPLFGKPFAQNPKRT